MKHKHQIFPIDVSSQDNGVGYLHGQSVNPPDEYMLTCYPDGACFNNGRQGYVANVGLGIVIGDDNHCWSIRVDVTLDAAPRTSQCSELLVAIEA